MSSTLEQYMRFPKEVFFQKNNFDLNALNAFDFEKINAKVNNQEIQITSEKNTFDFSLLRDRFTNKKSVLIICSKDNSDILKYTLEKIKSYNIDKKHDVFLVDDRSVDDSILELSDVFNTSYIKIFNRQNIFNYSIINNIAASYARARNKEVIVFYNNDLWPESSDSFDKIFDQHITNQSDITGCRLIYPTKDQYDEIGRPQHLLDNYLDKIYGTIQHGGIHFIVKPSSFIDNRRAFISNNLVLAPVHTWRFYDKKIALANNNSFCYAVTGALHIVNTDTFFDLDGFNIGLGTSFQDIDICLRAFAKNKKILYIGNQCMIHAESLTSAREKMINTQEFSSDNVLWDCCWGLVLPNVLGYQSLL